ncbi:hypothetical protein [Shewanella sp. SR43-8]|uniref:hypothetical protein n=1 Tax=Shewanella sp. SR43-8 TaxID=2760938 RepID=UPI0016040AC8|nr:hypothetical protein [Shewanella sp. SR43-8]MBB1322127.1 hypothetical protein [Shewanella sp. SR43-8]
MKKTNPDIVGKMRCDTCSSEMEVRQRSNGKKLLYTYCPKCKMDQRSGEAIQAFWRQNMVAPDAELAALVPEPAPTKPNPTETNTKADTENQLADWVPPENLQPDQEQDETKSSKLGWWIGGGVCLVLAAFGVRASMN